jgi:hypothetical protein
VTQRSILGGKSFDDEATILNEEILAEILAGVVAEMMAAPDVMAERRARLQDKRASLAQETTRLSAAIAQGGPLDALLKGLREREQRCGQIDVEWRCWLSK